MINRFKMSILCVFALCRLAATGGNLPPSLETGNPLHVLKQGEEARFGVRVPPDGVSEWEYSVTDVEGQVMEQGTLSPSSFQDGFARIPAPEKYGFYVFRILPKGTSGLEKQAGEGFAYFRPASSLPAVKSSFLFGVCDHPESYPPAEVSLMAEASRVCGVKVFRTDARWNLLQPQKDQWDFSYLDNAEKELSARGVELAPILEVNAPWATAESWKPKKLGYWKCQADPVAFRNYVHGLMTHYKGRIRQVEVFNEIDIRKTFSVEDYIKYLKIANAEIRKIDPSLMILSSGFANPDTIPEFCAEPDYIRKTILAGGSDFDVLAIHMHGNFSSYVRDVSKLKSILAATGFQKPWYANETADSSTSAGLKGQARTLFEKLIYSWANGSIGYNWYNLRDTGTNPDDSEHNFGLITHDFNPKPAYVTYNMLASTYSGAEFLADANAGQRISPDVYLYWFRRLNGDFLLSGWNGAGDSKLLLLTGITGKASVIDMWGNQTPLRIENGAAVIQISPEPVTLRISGQEKPPVVEGEFMTPKTGLHLYPGTRQSITWNLKNPTGKTLPFRIAFRPMTDLRIVPETRTLEIPPGATQTAAFTFEAGPAFASGNLSVTIDAGNLWNGTVPCWADAAVKVGNSLENRAPDFTLDKPSQVVRLVPFAPESNHLAWAGLQDLSGKVWLAERDNRFFIRVVVRDDIHRQPFHAGEAWKGDNIQCAFHLPRQAVFWEIGFSLTDGNRNEVHLWSFPTGFDPQSCIRRIVLKTSRNEAEKTTLYEAEIPFGAIGLTREMGKEGFRFNLVVNDNDGDLRKQFIGIAPGLASGKTSAEFPVLTF